MANQFVYTNSWVSMEILRLLLNKLVCTEYFNRNWEGDFKKEFAVGSQINVKLPWRPSTVSGMGYAPQGVTRISTTINLDQWIQVPWEWDDEEAALYLERGEEQLRENYFEPAAAAMAQEFDSRAAKFAYQNASNVVGTLGTSPTSVGTYYQARQKMEEQACPPGKRCMLISSQAMEQLGENITTIFHPGDEITRMWKKGFIGELSGFEFYESNSLYSHTAGTWAGTLSVTGAGQSGTSLLVTSTNVGDTLKQGDKISIPNVNAVNPMTKRVAGKAAAKQFTVTQDVTFTDGPDTIYILPAIYGPTSQYQNVDALPADGAAVTLWPGTTSPSAKVGTVGLALSKFAFGMVATKLYTPKAVEMSAQSQDPDSGIAVRKVKAWDPVKSMQVHRLDSLMGFGNLYLDSGACAVALA